MRVSALTRGPLKFPAHPLPGNIQILWHHPRLSHRRHEIGIPNPSRQPMQMQMPCHASTGSLTQIHPKVDSMWRIQRRQHPLGSLRQIHQFMRRRNRQRRQTSLMLVRNRHHVSRSIRKRIQADKAFDPAKDQSGRLLRRVHRHPFGDRMIHRSQQVAENTAQIPRPSLQLPRHTRPHRLISRSHIAVSPGSPKQIHIREYSARLRRLRLALSS